MVIIITFKRRELGPRDGQLLAALWAFNGTDADLNSALAYAHKSGPDYQVHTFATLPNDWKNVALEARKNNSQA